MPIFFCDKALGKIKPLTPGTLLSEIYQGIDLIQEFKATGTAIIAATCSPAGVNAKSIQVNTPLKTPMKNTSINSKPIKITTLFPELQGNIANKIDVVAQEKKEYPLTVTKDMARALYNAVNAKGKKYRQVLKEQTGKDRLLTALDNLGVEMEKSKLSARNDEKGYDLTVSQEKSQKIHGIIHQQLCKQIGEIQKRMHERKIFSLFSPSNTNKSSHTINAVNQEIEKATKLYNNTGNLAELNAHALIHLIKEIEKRITNENSPEGTSHAAKNIKKVLRTEDTPKNPSPIKPHH